MANVLKEARNHELELKFKANGVEAGDYIEFMASTQCMTGYRRTESPDIYYRQGKNVLRFRGLPSGKGATVTVKLRTSKKSTSNRIEIDIPVGPDICDEDVHAFLEATGWRPEVRLFKISHIIDIEDFYFSSGGKSPPVCIALYTVCREFLNPKGGVRHSKKTTFLEVEVEKAYVDGRAEDVLEKWKAFINNKWDLGEPLNQSLYEYYTGRSYRMMTKKERGGK
jgi:hypothetical protein